MKQSATEAHSSVSGDHTLPGPSNSGGAAVSRLGSSGEITVTGPALLAEADAMYVCGYGCVAFYAPICETAFVRSRRTSSAVDRRAGLPVRSIAATGSTLATSTFRSEVSRTMTLQGSRTPNLSSIVNASCAYRGLQARPGYGTCRFPHRSSI